MSVYLYIMAGLRVALFLESRCDRNIVQIGVHPSHHPTFANDPIHKWASYSSALLHRRFHYKFRFCQKNILLKNKS